MGSMIVAYISFALAIFILSVLALDSSRRDETERKIIGWIGLTSPVWPLTAVVGIIVLILLSGRYLLRVVRGRE